MIVKNNAIFIIPALVVVSILVYLQYRGGENTAPVKVAAVLPGSNVVVANAPGQADKFAYAFTFEREGKINSETLNPAYTPSGKNKAGALAVKSRLSGAINIQFIHNRNGAKLYFARFSSLDAGQNPSRATATHPSIPFAFLLDKNGSLSLYDEGMLYEEEFINLALQLLPYLQVVGLGAAADQWQTKEIDLVGRYKSDYTAERSGNLTRIQKRKQGYDKVNALPSLFKPEHADAQARVLHHEAVVDIYADALWPSEITVSERILMESGGNTISDIPTKFVAHYAEFDSHIEMPRSLSELTELLSARAGKIDDDYYVDDKLSALVAGKDFDNVISYYYEMSQTNEFLAKKVLANYLRLHPDFSKDFVDRIYADQNNLTDNEEVKLWYVLAKAGHKEAQDAYIYALENSDFNKIVQYRAIGHLRVFEKPTAEFVEDLWHIQGKLYRQGVGNEADSQVLASGALFAIATLSTSKKIDSRVRESILDNLEKKLYSATDDRARISLVTAIGNTNNPALMSSITPHLDSTNALLRGEAFKAMARMPGDEAVDTYIDAYERINPTDHNMQFQALSNLQKMSLKKESLAWVSHKALQLNNKTETQHLIQILGDNIASSPAAEVTLRKLLTKNISPQLKSAIYKYIAPQS